MFLAKTTKKDLFMKPNAEEEGDIINKHLEPKKYPEDLTEDQLAEVQTHKHIRLSMKDNFCLFISNILGKLFCFGYCW